MGTIGCPETSAKITSNLGCASFKNNKDLIKIPVPGAKWNRQPMLATQYESLCKSQSTLERRKLHRVTWALMNAWRGSEFVRKTYFALSKDRVSTARIIQTVKCCGCLRSASARTHTHARARLRYTVHEKMCVCVFVYVNMLLLPTDGKMVKVIQVIIAYVKNAWT